MKVAALLLLVSVMQVTLTTGQVHSQYTRRQGSLRRNGGAAAQNSADSGTSSSIFPAFITRAFGGGSESPSRKGPSGRPGGPRPVGGGGRSKKTRAPNRQTSRRPLGATSLANFAGGGPLAAGSIPRRRIALENAASGVVVSQAALASRPALGATVGHALPASLRAAATPPQSLEGWLSYPTEAPSVTTAKYTPTVANKAGTCGSEHSYGIKCRERMDQCSVDAHCPGATRCCMVGDCGYLCVKPKATSEGEKKRWGVASNVLKRQREEEGLVIEMSTTATGLKLDDITDHKLKLEQ